MSLNLRPLSHEDADPELQAALHCELCGRRAIAKWQALVHAGWHRCVTPLDRTVYVCEPCSTTRRRKQHTTPPPSPTDSHKPGTRAYSRRHPALVPKRPSQPSTLWLRPWFIAGVLLGAAALILACLYLLQGHRHS
jgi:hypothetical protein